MPIGKVAKVKRRVIVDGANVAYLQKTHNGRPLAVNIAIVKQTLEKKGFEPIIIVDSNLYYEVADQDQIEALLNEGAILQVPTDTDAENYIIEASQEYGAPIISNDSFEAYIDQHPWIEERRVPAMLLSENDEIEFYQLDNLDLAF